MLFCFGHVSFSLIVFYSLITKYFITYVQYETGGNRTTWTFFKRKIVFDVWMGVSLFLNIFAEGYSN